MPISGKECNLPGRLSHGIWICEADCGLKNIGGKAELKHVFFEINVDSSLSHIVENWMLILGHSSM